MPTAPGTDWRKDFGIEGRTPPSFFSSKNELTPSTPQAHMVRRAFDVLDLDGVLCTDHSPLVYFKQVKHITADAAAKLHRQFWNQGGAPVLVLITEDKVHVYSGLSRPVAKGVTTGRLPSLVDEIDRAATGLREFLTSVESGEFFHKYAKSFD